MTYISIFLLALALSIDAFVVSFSYGLVFTENKFINSLSLAISTGGFQGLMPIIGYFLTYLVRAYIEPYAKFIVFFIFCYLGLKFIIEAFQKEKQKELCIDIKCLLFLGIATSIDAFSAGISLSLYGNGVIKPALLIALITFVNANIGFFLGDKLKHLPTQILETFAGIILIMLAVKALIIC